MGKLYTPGERYVTLGSLIRIVLECILILILKAGSEWEFQHGYRAAGCVFLAAAAVGLALTVLLAPTRWRY